MNIDESIAKRIIMQNKYIKTKHPRCFQSEIQSFIVKKLFPKEEEENDWILEIQKEIPENFYMRINDS